MSASGLDEFTNYQEIAYQSIQGFGTDDGHWQFIASPLTENVEPDEIDKMISEANAYDFYYFDQTENAEWRNYKANSFNLVNGQGYLYANAENVNLIFKGEFNEDEMKNEELVYDAKATLAGWNLVGNPFPVNAYANRSYYVMNEDGTAIEPTTVSSATAIAPCMGIMVKAETTDESVTFSKTALETQGQNNGLLQIVLSKVVEPAETPTLRQAQGPALLDKAIVSFNASDALEKFVFNEDNAKLYIPQNGKDYAIAAIGKDVAHNVSTDICFKAAKNGQYTLSVNPENIELDYLHLIDNMTGADIDLLASPTYTFNATTGDYASRFRLVFSGQVDEPSAPDQPFAYYADDQIILTGIRGNASEASLQIIDVMGRVVASFGAHTRCVPTAGMPAGVYVLRFISGNDVKTQKIVVR